MLVNIHKMKIFYASLVSLMVYSTGIAVANTVKHNAMKPLPKMLLADNQQDQIKKAKSSNNGGGHKTSNKAAQQTHAPVSHKASQPTHHAPVSHQISHPTHHGVTHPQHNKTQTLTPNATKKLTPSNKITTHGVQPVLHLGPNAGTVNSTANIHPNVVNTSVASHQITQKNIHNSRTLNKNFISSPNHAKWTKNISNSQNNYRHNFHNNLLQNAQGYNSYYHNAHYHNWYNHWHSWGFYGGFWYPFYPSYDIYDYFYYPAVYWFFVETPMPEDYYSDYYPSASPPSGACLTSFPYNNIYYPTKTLRDLLIEMSGLPPTVLCQFRAAVINFTSQLQQDVTANYGTSYSYSHNSVVITYYQNLQNQAIVLSGYVSDNNIHMAFEGFLDINNPDQSIAFAPKGQNPTADEIQTLTQLNNRIKNLGGNPIATQPATGTGDPTQPPAGAATENNTAPGP